MLLREFLGIREPEATARSAQLDPLAAAGRRHLEQLLRGAANLSTTIESYVALRLAGDTPRSRTCGPQPSKSAPPEDCSRRGCSHTSGWRCSAPGRGPGAGAAAGDDPAAELVPAQRLRLRLLGSPDRRGALGRARGAAGQAAAVHARRARRARALVASRGDLRSAARWSRSTACCRSTSGTRWRRCAARAGARRSAGSSTARRPTAAGAGSSRRGCTR